jgi:CRP/FNR family cyclic AMP-dependent transcriptional regulator
MSTLKQDQIEIKIGEYLTKEGQPCVALYIVKEGQLKVFKIKDGVEIPLGIISSGEYVGEMSLLTGSYYTTSVVALTPTKVIRIQKSAIEKQLEQSPKWLVALTRGLVERLHHANEVLKRNGIVDEKMNSAIHAIEAKNPSTSDS